MRKCSKCKKVKLVDEFNFKIKKLGLLHVQCRECTRALIKAHYDKNREYYLDKADKRNSKIKLEVLSYINQHLMENPCIDCGESDLAVLEFDHVGKKPKFKAMSSLIRLGFPLDKIKEEINKCEVRCANCHRRKTYKQFGHFGKTKPL